MAAAEPDSTRLRPEAKEEMTTPLSPLEGTMAVSATILMPGIVMAETAYDVAIACPLQ